MRGALSWLRTRRWWFYAAFVLVAVAWIPARTGFQLQSPACDARLTLPNVGLSLAKVPHIMLFGMFFLLTVVQFDRIDRKALGLSFLATVVFGFVVEIEEGATRTGNCRFTDVVPDALGVLIAMALLMTGVMVRDRFYREQY